MAAAFGFRSARTCFGGRDQYRRDGTKRAISGASGVAAAHVSTSRRKNCSVCAASLIFVRSCEIARTSLFVEKKCSSGGSWLPDTSVCSWHVALQPSWMVCSHSRRDGADEQLSHELARTLERKRDHRRKPPLLFEVRGQPSDNQPESFKPIGTAVTTASVT
jgi:hypothetical protein